MGNDSNLQWFFLVALFWALVLPIKSRLAAWLAPIAWPLVVLLALFAALGFPAFEFLLSGPRWRPGVSAFDAACAAGAHRASIAVAPTNFAAVALPCSEAAKTNR